MRDAKSRPFALINMVGPTLNQQPKAMAALQLRKLYL